MAVPRILRIFKVREEGNLEFWVSNAVIVLSTVLGVYLAAQAGYKTAVAFELARQQREGYFMRRALLDELKDNLDQADEMSKNMMDSGWRFTNSNPEIFKLQSYVWETMKQQSTTFQIPSEILTGVRRYYDKAGGFGRMLAVGQGTAVDGAKQWMKETQDMRDKLIPAMEKDVAALRDRLTAQGLELN
jgi:hypothetical protein